jgi:GWxTD domain-containing protein
VENLDSLARANAKAPGDLEVALRYARALALENSISARRRAGEVLHRARRDHPHSAELHLALADLYYRQGFLTMSKGELRAALQADSSSAPAYARLGRLAFRDWLKFQRSEALTLARHFWEESAKDDPQDTESWLGLGILALLANDAPGADHFARRCLAIAQDPGARTRARSGLYPVGASGATPERAFAAPDPRGEGWLLLGAALYLEGDLEPADSAFTSAMRYLSAGARHELLDITQAASDFDTVAFREHMHDSGEAAEFLRQFWQARDPDLTTPVNELRLEYLMRGAVAYFLFFDPRRQAWDERGTILVRFGMPEEVLYNPITYFGYTPTTTNRLVWRYPTLGMDVYLEDRYLNETYDLPIQMFHESDPEPDTAAVRQEVEAGEIELAGRGIFHPAHLGPLRLPGAAETAVFRRVKGFDPRSGATRGANTGHLEVYLAVTGRTEPTRLTATAVVLDSTWHEVMRHEETRATWCVSDTVHLFQMNFDLPDGKYTIGVSARDPARGRYQSWRIPVELTRPEAGLLEMSDLELACAYEPAERGGPFDKPSFTVLPNPLRKIEAGTPVAVYFETYGLTPDETGHSQITVEYSMASLRQDKRFFVRKWLNPRHEVPVVQVVRDDDVAGRVRFEYVTAALAQATPGPYRLEVSITDRATQRTVKKDLDFLLVPASE